MLRPRSQTMSERPDFSNTKSNILYKDYYSSGELFSTYNPIDGKETFYYKGGGLCRESYSRDGILFGEMLLYTEHGEIHTKKVYKNGKVLKEEYFDTKKRERIEKELEENLNIQTDNNGEAAAKSVKKAAVAKRKEREKKKKEKLEKKPKTKQKKLEKKPKTKNIFK